MFDSNPLFTRLIANIFFLSFVVSLFMVPFTTCFISKLILLRFLFSDGFFSFCTSFMDIVASQIFLRTVGRDFALLLLEWSCFSCGPSFQVPLVSPICVANPSKKDATDGLSLWIWAGFADHQDWLSAVGQGAVVGCWQPKQRNVCSMCCVVVLATNDLQVSLRKW